LNGTGKVQTKLRNHENENETRNRLEMACKLTLESIFADVHELYQIRNYNFDLEWPGESIQIDYPITTIEHHTLNGHVPDVITRPPLGQQNIMMRLCEILCNHCSKLPNFLCMLTMAVAQASSDDIAARYIHAVLRVMSCLHIVASSMAVDTRWLTVSSTDFTRQCMLRLTHQQATFDWGGG